MILFLTRPDRCQARRLTNFGAKVDVVPGRRHSLQVWRHVVTKLTENFAWLYRSDSSFQPCVDDATGRHGSPRASAAGA